MNEVKRYDLVGDMDGNCNLNEARMELSADGVYVKHNDYASLKAKCAELAAESAGLKAGAMYFSYGSEFSFECHKTADEAIAAAETAIDDYRGDARDGWSEEVESICWGVIIQQATKVGERKKRKCDRVSPWIERVCDYELRPNVETPATDTFLAEIECKAIRKFINSIEHILRDKLSPYDTEEMLEAMRIFLEEQGGEQK